MSFVRENGGMEYASRRLGDFVSEAVDALEVLPASEEKNFLRDIAYFVGERLS